MHRVNCRNAAMKNSEPAEAEAAQALVGTTLADRYRIEELLGAGGMGAVYRAVHVNMHKTVALKLLHPELATVPEVVARFEREAMVAGRLEHPNVAAALDFGKLPDGSLYLVMEFVPGGLLRDALKEGPLPPGRVARIGMQIAAGLAAAHAAGIVHRDLKPENIMLRSDGAEEQVKVLDLGIAKLAADPEPRSGKALTKVGAVLGTPQYMAPEQAIGGTVDHRADLYALGVVLYEMAVGKPPFPDEDGAHAVIARHLTEPPPALPASVPEPLAALIVELLQKSASARPQSALDVAARLQQSLEQPAAQALPVASGVKTRSKRPLLLAAGALTLVVLGAWLAKAITGAGEEVEATPESVPSGDVGAAAAALTVPAPQASEQPAPPAPKQPAPPPAAKARTTERAAAKPPPRRKGKKKEERNEVGGIYIPPPDKWFD
jgi:eukaryotic-like serine/threonine-protein kinase